MSVRSVLLCGLPGTGKTTLGKVLAERTGYLFLEASDTAKAFYARERHADEAYLKYIDRVFRSDGGQRFAESIAAEATAWLSTEPGIIVSGMRHVREIETLRRAIPGTLVVFLSCPTQLRHRRKPTIDPVIGQGVAECDEIEHKWKVPYLNRVADRTLDTSGTIEDSVAGLFELVAGAGAER